MEQQNINKEKYEGKQLISYTVNMSGTMQSGKSSTTVSLSDDGTYATIWIQKHDRYDLEIMSQMYVADKSLLDEIAKIVLEDKVYSAKISETTPYVVYDMPVISYVFRYEGGISLWFSNSQELANTFYKSLDKIDALIKEYADKSAQTVDESERREQKVQNFCTECGKKWIKGDKFCRECGTPVFQ